MAHSHPHSIIVHQSTFFTAMSNNQIPPHLLFAICALGAPYSKQSCLMTNPSRLAGAPFAAEAMRLMFDAEGHMLCYASLATVQALCFLLEYGTLVSKPDNQKLRSKSSFYHSVLQTQMINSADLALKILDSLGVHSSSPNPTSYVGTPPPPADLPPFQTSIDRECARRAFWLIHFMDLTSSVYSNAPMPSMSQKELMMRLPVDEIVFQGAGCHAPPGESSLYPAR